MSNEHCIVLNRLYVPWIVFYRMWVHLLHPVAMEWTHSSRSGRSMFFFLRSSTRTKSSFIIFPLRVDFWHVTQILSHIYKGSWTVIWIMGLGMLGMWAGFKGFVWLELIEHCRQVNEILPLLLLGIVEKGQGMIWRRGGMGSQNAARFMSPANHMVFEHLH